MVAHMPHVHAAAAHAGAAAAAAVLVDLHTDDAEAVEQTVDRAKRTKETAEAPVAEDTGQSDHQHDAPFAGKQDPQHAKHPGVGRVDQMAHRAFRGSCRTDVFAESRQGHVVAQAVDQRYGDHEHCQDHILQPGQCPGDRVFPDLGCGDLMQQFLDQSKRAQPAADGPSQDHAVEQNDPEHIPSCPVPGRGKRVLK